VTVLAHVDTAYRLAARSADLVFVTPGGTYYAGTPDAGPTGDAATVLRGVRDAQREVGRDDDLPVLGDLLVLLDDTAAAADERRQRLDTVDGPLRTDAQVVAGTASDVADVIEGWQQAGLAGARLRPAVTAHDLPRITRELVPELQRRGLFRTAYDADTLRGHLGLTRPASRYAAAP
jgi:alkanesulfonate monooxygenase SsuD/methylene tetrahydromethanopterin reductase-like flavin-dependent oxidoreductase (luciferase family)